MKDIYSKSQSAGTSNFDLPEADKSRLIKQYERCPVSSGRSQYLRYLHGEKLTHMEAVLAKCAECNCGYIDGRYDCGIQACPLYLFMPYKGKVSPDFKEEV